MGLSIPHNYYTFDGLETLAQNNHLTSFKCARQRAIDIHQNNNVLSVYAGGTHSNNTYSWFNNGVLVSTITGDSTFTPTTNGNYSVEVTNSIVTELTLRSDTVSINAVGVVEQNNSDAVQANNKINFSVYPNPAKTNVTVSFATTGNYTLQLTDVNGNVLQAKTGIAANNKNTVYQSLLSEFEQQSINREHSFRANQYSGSYRLVFRPQPAKRQHSILTGKFSFFI